MALQSAARPGPAPHANAGADGHGEQTARARYAAALFDCDGTLLDSIADLAGAGNAVCEKNGWPTHSIAEFKRMVGNGQRILVRRFAPPELRENPEILDAAYNQFCDYYAVHSLDHTVPYPGIIDALDELRSAGIVLGVLTNKNADAAQNLIKRFFGERFAWVEGRRDGIPPKPDPTMTRELMQRLGCDESQAIVIGDTGVDIDCGVNAGIDSCGALWGFRDRNELVQHGATYIAERPSDLAGIIVG
jgi:phosphoglycolate phosphatase